ncbi:PIG-L deacetylase family protein [Sphingomonas sp.]|uniref:PIG-L deacetylase family protein n=1 Tax=Sphingomonas sp. TaxID=28214 RepID=UPI0035BBDF67
MRRLPLGRVRRALVVAPHPDDEAIGAWGVIRALRRRGRHVRVVVVADGAASHPNSVAWPRHRLVAARRRETRAAMRAIGVSARDVVFLGLPDGKLAALARHAAQAVTRAIAAARADLIVLPCATDDHPDHRAVAAAAARARMPGARRFAYLVWTRGARSAPMYGFPAGGLPKRAAIGRYRTQTGAIRDDPGGFAIAPHELRAFSRPIEWFRELSR